MGFDLINKLKKEKGWTNEKLAEKSGVPKATIDKITSGSTTNPNFDTVWALAEALGCSVDDFKQKEKASDPKVSESEAEINKVAELLYHAFLEAGLVEKGQNLTAKQIAFIDGLVGIIHAFFNED